VIILEFDWPVSELSPNSRNRWGKIAAAKAARAMGRYTVMQWRENYHGPVIPLTGDLEVQYHFYPPDKRRRDLDNCHAMMKSYQDGVFETLGLDDSKIEMVEIRRCAVTPPGKVVMFLTQFETMRF
jgi:crossover junction endodeoxyribonuclease RusA